MYLAGPIEGTAAVSKAGRDREATAWHEAGHALVGYLDSGGTDIPEFVSITPTASYEGIMVGSVEYGDFAYERMRYSDFRHRIRVSLAGRAAEELAYGPEGISAGCASDLESASWRTYVAFSSWGFSPEMEKSGSSSGNLFTVLDEPSDHAARHIESLCRTFLDQQYRQVMDLLILHHESLVSIKDALMAEAALDSSGFLNYATIPPRAA
jgi:ATP-dependent Zn protease